ncbi:MAG: hypothetical protein AAF125_15415 [Chloroflexota bacterium]
MSNADVQWYNDDHTVLMLAINNGVTWSEIVEAANKINAFVISVEHQVYTVVDGSSTAHIPHGNMMLMRDVMAVKSPENAAVMFVVIGSRLMQRVFDTLMNTFGSLGVLPEIRVVNSIEVAFREIERLQQEDA